MVLENLLWSVHSPGTPLLSAARCLMSRISAVIVSVSLCAFVGAATVRAEELPPKYRDSVKKGLEFLKKQQAKDGHWAAQNNAYPVTMTGLAGLAMLMEGSTVREGQYSAN